MLLILFIEAVGKDAKSGASKALRSPRQLTERLRRLPCWNLALRDRYAAAHDDEKSTSRIALDEKLFTFGDDFQSAELCKLGWGRRVEEEGEEECVWVRWVGCGGERRAEYADSSVLVRRTFRSSASERCEKNGTWRRRCATSSRCSSGRSEDEDAEVLPILQKAAPTTVKF